MNLFPKITITRARQLVSQLNELNIVEIHKQVTQDSTPVDQTAVFSAVGGTRVTSHELLTLRQIVMDLAHESGFPSPPVVNARQHFDQECSRLLHQRMNIMPYEAADIRVWAHMTCVLMPDIVRWRFDGEKTSEDRFIGSDSGRRRNAFGRLWWRAYQLVTPGHPQGDYVLLEKFGEDDLVQVSERPTIFGSGSLSRMFLLAVLEAQEDSRTTLSWRDILRDAMKRLRRLITIVEFDTLSESQLRAAVREVVDQSVRMLDSSQHMLHP